VIVVSNTSPITNLAAINQLNLFDLRHLALMDFLLEHYEEIPEQLRNLLCPPDRNP
jgi:predicted nucleic acid-binding protein